MDQLPFAEGTYCGRLPEQGRMTQEMMRNWLSTATTLRDLSAEFAIFSPAALLTLGNLPQDPLQVWLNRQPEQDILLGPLQFDFAVLRGLPALSNVLWFCQLDKWPALCQELSGLVGWDPGRRQVWFSQLQSLEIVDPLALSHMSTLPDQLPLVGVSLFGLNSSYGDFRFVRDGWQVALKQFPPRSDTCAAAASFASQDAPIIISQ